MPNPPKPAAQKDPRAVKLGEWLQAWRLERGLTRPEAVSEMQKHNPHATISSDYLAKIEYGQRNLASASAEVREALRQALNIPRQEWEEETGLLIPAPRGGSPIPPVVPFRETPVNIPDELQRMIDNNADRYPILRDPTIQRIIAAPRNFGGPANGPQTEEDWLEYWVTNRRWFTS